MITEHVAGDVWRVKSDSSEKWYNVDLGIPNCTCPNWNLQRNKLIGEARNMGRPDSSVRYECKHIREVLVTGVVTQRNARNKEAGLADAKAQRDAIVSRFTSKAVKKRAIETMREMKKGK